MRSTNITFAAMAVALVAVLPAGAVDRCDETNPNGVIGTNGVDSDPSFKITGGTINMSGATLFVDFFRQPAATNDWIDADNDGRFGYIYPDPEYLFVDQLGMQYTPGSFLDSWWLFTYRSVGSVNGFNEFIDSQLCGIIPTDPPSEAGIFNRYQFASGGAATGAGYVYANSSGIPLEQCSIDGAFLDVPSSWAVYADPAGSEAVWYRRPTEAAYGLNPIPSSIGFISNLQSLSRDGCGSLNTSTDSPDEDTLFDVIAAWVPVTLIANRGTALENIKYSEAQYVFTTGRMPNGENLIGATRDVGSGTRNAAMNSLGVDTSWGRGDNIGKKDSLEASDLIGPDFQPTNKGGSSRMEGAVENARLAVGYTGLAGSSRSAKDHKSGKYEILNVCQDIDENGDPLCDCTPQACEFVSTPENDDADRANNGYVRPSIDTVLDNLDPCCGYRIAGSGSFVVRGNPDANRDPSDPKYVMSQPIANQAVADYINNIIDSTEAFTGNVQSNGLYNTPGQYLATEFFLPQGIDGRHVLSHPLDYIPSAGFTKTLQEFIRDNNDLGAGGDTAPFGSINAAGRVPTRTVLAGGAKYSDGQAGSYVYWDGTQYRTAAGGTTLAERNQVAADFDKSYVRDVNDATEMVKAYYTPRAWQQTVVANDTGDAGNMDADNAIPEIIGDFNGDGDFTKEDLRYFADGLAMSNGKLDRKAGAVAIDNAMSMLGKPYPWADTNGMLIVPSAAQYGEPSFIAPKDVDGAAHPFLATGKAYAAGDFRADVAGGHAVAGAAPMGWDGRVDATDIDYVCQNIGDWDNLDEAVYMDLSADMDGDAAVTTADVAEIVEQILGTTFGDANLDRVVNNLDREIVGLGMSAACNADESCGWSDGDVNCDGIVDESDLAIATPVLGDFDGDSDVDLTDYIEFANCLAGPGVQVAPSCRVFDVDVDTDVDLNDYSLFQSILTIPSL